jgi:hypothetical protein
MTSIVMLSVIYAECHNKVRIAECRYAKCRFAECHSSMNSK